MRLEAPFFRPNIRLAAFWDSDYSPAARQPKAPSRDSVAFRFAPRTAGCNNVYASSSYQLSFLPMKTRLTGLAGLSRNRKMVLRMMTRPLTALLLSTFLLASSTGCQLAADGQNLAGVRHYDQGQYAAALQRFQQAVTDDPENGDAYYNMAATMHRVGVQSNNPELLTQAETLYNQCLDVDEGHVDCHRGLAVLLVETNRADRAFKLLKNWAIASPQAADPRIELARLYEEFGDLETAKIHLQDAVQIDRHEPRAWAALASLREKSGEYSQALANYQRAYSLQGEPKIAQRIAALSGQVGGAGFDVPTSSGTRTVSSPTTPRY